MLSVVQRYINVNLFYKQWLIFRNTTKTITVNANATHQNNRWTNTNTFNAQHMLDSRIQRIDYYARKVGRVTVGEITDMFNDIKRLPQSSPTSYSHSLLLIGCCGSLLSEVLPSARNQLVNEIFDFLSNSTKLYISHYNSLLQVYLDNEYEFNPLDILNKIEERGIEPNLVTYQRLIHRYCKLGDIEGATKIMGFMKSKQLPINEYVFNSLILGYGKAGDLESAYNTLELMKKSGLEPNGDTYTSLLCAYALNANNPDAIKKIPEFIEEANRNEIALTESDYLELDKILAQIDSNLPLIDELIKTIPKTAGSNQECMKAICSLCHNKQFDTAFKIYDTMLASTLQVKNKTVGNFFIRQLIKANAPTDLILNWTTMQEENIQPSGKTLRLLSKILQQNNVKVLLETPPPIFPSKGDVDSSLPKEKSTFGQEKYTLNQLNNALRHDSLDEAIEIKKAIESRGYSVLTQNCAIMDSLLELDRVNEAFDIAYTLLQNKLYPSPRVLRFLLSKLAAKGDIKLIEKLKNLLPSSVVETTFYTSILATAYTNAGKSEEFINELLPNLKPFPNGGVLAILNIRPDLEDLVLKIANQINAEQDNHLPLNMVWLYYMKNERYDDAQRIYNSSPKFKEYLVFTPLLVKIKQTKNITMAKKLIDITKMTPKTIGVVYSSLIEVYLELNDVYRAEAIITDVILPNNEMRDDTRTGSNVKVLDIKNINGSTLIRLSNAIRAENREPKFEIPKRVLNNASKEKEEEN